VSEPFWEFRILCLKKKTAFLPAVPGHDSKFFLGRTFVFWYEITVFCILCPRHCTTFRIMCSSLVGILYSLSSQWLWWEHLPNYLHQHILLFRASQYKKQWTVIKEGSPPPFFLQMLRLIWIAHLLLLHHQFRLTCSSNVNYCFENKNVLCEKNN
jgi:hypothetical protein